MGADSVVVNVISTPRGGGAEFLVRELTRQLLLYKVDAYAVYFEADGEFLALDNEVLLSIPSRSPFSIFLIRRKIKAIYRQCGPLIVHAHLTWPFFYTVLACLGLPVKLVYTEHNTTNRRRGIKLLKYVERWFYSRYERIICISEAVEDSVARWLGPGSKKSLVTINNGARILEFKERVNVSRPLRLISIGSLSVQKGFDVAIQAVSMASELVDEYLIIGEGEERNRLSELIANLGLQDKVKLLGWCDDIQKYLHAADVQLIPSRWEGFGLVAVEGMSTGLPVIASDVDGLREVLGPNLNDAALLVADHRAAEEWVDKINLMAGKLREDAKILACSSRRRSECFAFDDMIIAYAELYKSIS